MDKRYWFNVDVSMGPMEADGSEGPAMAGSPSYWRWLSYADLVEMEEELHATQGRMIAWAKARAAAMQEQSAPTASKARKRR